MIEPGHGFVVEDKGEGDPAGDEGGGEAHFEGEGVESHAFTVGCGDFIEYLLCLWM